MFALLSERDGDAVGAVLSRRDQHITGERGLVGIGTICRRHHGADGLEGRLVIFAPFVNSPLSGLDEGRGRSGISLGNRLHNRSQDAGVSSADLLASVLADKRTAAPLAAFISCAL